MRAYTAATMGQHNARVDKWVQIAKPVIPGPNIDLILLPHTSDNALVYDTGTGPCSASGCPGVPHSGVAHDPVTGNYYPIVNTSVTFRPGTVSGDAVPGTTADYGNLGLPTLDSASGYAYIPTVYTATGRSWALPYHVSLYPGNYNGSAGVLRHADLVRHRHDQQPCALHGRRPAGVQPHQHERHTGNAGLQHLEGLPAGRQRGQPGRHRISSR